MDEDALRASLELPPIDPLIKYKRTAESIIKRKIQIIQKPNLTEEQIHDILAIIPAPPTIEPKTRELVWKKIVEIVRKDLENKYVELATIPKLKKALRFHIQRSFVIAGTPIGISSVGDDMGAGAIQGALDARKKPGSRQNAAGGIQMMREVFQITKRSIPTVTVYFENSHNFYDIMQNWRPKLMHISFKNIVMSYDIILTKETPYPDWYDSYSELRNKIDKHELNIPATGKYYVVIELNLSIIYSYKITSEVIYTQIRAVLDETNAKVFKKKKQPLSDFIILYPPGVPRTLHLIPITESSNIGKLKSRSEEEEDESITTSNVPLKQNQQSIIRKRLPEIMNAYISGIPGITYVYPVPINILESIRSEKYINNSTYEIEIDQTNKRVHNIDELRVGMLFNATGCQVLEYEPFRVRVPSLNKSPIEYTEGKINELIRNKVMSKLKETIQEDGTWRVESNELSDEQISSFFTLAGITIISRSPIIVRPPETQESAIEFVKRRVREDINEQKKYEQSKRLERYSGARISILREPSKIELTSTHYFIECTGGTFDSFIDIDGIDLSRTYSNNIKEMHNALGIEGARSLLVKEIDLAYTNSSLKLETITIHTAASKMTYLGYLIPYTHIGISMTRIGALARTTLQRPIHTLQQATVNKEIDPLTSASGAIMVGKNLNLGTGLPRTFTPVLDKYEYEEDQNEFKSKEKICRLYDE